MKLHDRLVVVFFNNIEFLFTAKHAFNNGDIFHNGGQEDDEKEAYETHSVFESSQTVRRYGFNETKKKHVEINGPDKYEKKI